MFFIIIFILCVGIHAQRKTSNYYDTYTGNFISLEEYQQHVRDNTFYWCTGELLKPCDPREGRRVDGTCNNLKYPTRGAIHTPTYRLLPAEYDAPEFNPRKAENGCELPPVRPTRMSIVQEGCVPDPRFTQLLSSALVSFANDVIIFLETVNYVVKKPYCCTPRGKMDPECVPIDIPKDDPVHQFSGIRCQNMTRPRSFQSSGCVKDGSAPVRIISSTPSFDLSHVYGNTLESLNKKGRLFVGGLLKFEVENGKIWPPSSKSENNMCHNNQKPSTTRCHDVPENDVNGILPGNLFMIWLWQHHNVIAEELGKINPCWDDEKLFQTARDMNIAYAMQMFYYEMFADLMGYENLVNDNVLSRTCGFRDLYNEEIYPQISVEFPFTLRWAHLFQDTKLKLYDPKGYYMKDIQIVNLTLGTGHLVDNIEFITQGFIRQACGKLDDYVVDPFIGEKCLGSYQRMLDVTSSDLAKNRYFGFAPYIKYKELCSGKQYKKFVDLLDTIDPERVELLAEVYKHIRDIDLIVGIMLERRTYGFVPPTFYCLIVNQLLRTIVSDRHWYERPNRPNAFTLEQLQEIRKATVARLLCDVGDSVTNIQPKAFRRAGPHNKMCSCDLIPKMDFTAWKDATCLFM